MKTDEPRNPNPEHAPAHYAPEQELELETLRAQTATAQARAAEASRKLAAEGERRQESLVKSGIQAGIAGSQIQFHANDIVDVLIRQQFYPEIDVTGNVSVLVNGRRQPVTEAAKVIAAQHPELVRGSLPGDMRQEQDQRPTSKAELHTVAEKSAFIDKFGFTAWEALPLNTMVLKPSDQLTLEEFRKLPISERTKLIAEHGMSYMDELSRRYHNKNKL